MSQRAFSSWENLQFLMNKNIYCHEVCLSPRGLGHIMTMKAVALKIVEATARNVATLTIACMKFVAIEQTDEAPDDVWSLGYAVGSPIPAGWNPKTATKQVDQRPDKAVGIEHTAESASAARRDPTTATK